jgi:predicted anti-sigma-YlaC factor YlaD
MKYAMKCHSVQKKLSAYQDNELETHEREQVKNHMLSCQSCREEYEKLNLVWQTLGKLEGIHPDPWLYRQLVRKIKEPHEQAFLPILQHVSRLFPAAVTVSVILAIGITVGSYLGGVLARFDLFPFQTNPASYSQEALFTSMRFFDPAPPGSFADGYLRVVG